MAGMQFEYDEKGGTFYYFLLSFFALVLVPATYYLWPRKTSKGEFRTVFSLRCASETRRLATSQTPQLGPGCDATGQREVRACGRDQSV